MPLRLGKSLEQQGTPLSSCVQPCRIHFLGARATVFGGIDPVFQGLQHKHNASQSCQNISSPALEKRLPPLLRVHQWLHEPCASRFVTLKAGLARAGSWLAGWLAK